MIEYQDAHKVKAGSDLVAVGTRTADDLTSGKTYQAIYGAEEGIFPCRPYVSVIADDGRKHTYHLSRFAFPEGDRV